MSERGIDVKHTCLIVLFVQPAIRCSFSVAVTIAGRLAEAAFDAEKYLISTNINSDAKLVLTVGCIKRYELRLCDVKASMLCIRDNKGQWLLDGISIDNEELSYGESVFLMLSCGNVVEL